MGWRCVSVRRRLALFVGDDLSEHEKRSVEFHLNECASCRDLLAALHRSREVIQKCSTEPAETDTSPSLWQSVRRQLTEREFSRGPRRSWLPAGAVAAATIAIGVVLWNRPGHLEPVQYRSSFPSTSTTDFSFTVSSLDSGTMIGHSANEGLSAPPPYFHLESAHPVEFIPDEF